MGKALREIYGECLAKYASENKRIVALDADLANSSKSGMIRQTAPDRLFDVGIAESNMIAMGAGFASSGFIPFVNTFATLAASMCAACIKAVIGYSGLNVRIMGSNNGVGGGYDGATHHAFDDINVMRGIPGMTVLTPSDGIQLDWMIKTLVYDFNGPVYVSIPRQGYENIYEPGEHFQIAKAKQLTQGKDAAIIANGLSVYRAKKAVEELEKEGIHVSLYDMFTIKPLDRGAVIRAARETGAIITVEEHSIVGGLGTAVLETLAEEQIAVPVHRLGIQDCYTQSGSYEELIKIYGMDIASIVSTVHRSIQEKR
jgi:transketolase